MLKKIKLLSLVTFMSGLGCIATLFPLDVASFAYGYGNDATSACLSCLQNGSSGSYGGSQPSSGSGSRYGWGECRDPSSRSGLCNCAMRLAKQDAGCSNARVTDSGTRWFGIIMGYYCVAESSC